MAPRFLTPIMPIRCASGDGWNATPITVWNLNLTWDALTRRLPPGRARAGRGRRAGRYTLELCRAGGR